MQIELVYKNVWLSIWGAFFLNISGVECQEHSVVHTWIHNWLLLNFGPTNSQVLFLETARFKLSTSLSIAHLEHTNFVVAICRYEGVGLQTSVIS